MKFFKYLVLALSVVLLFSACSKDDDVKRISDVSGTYQGAFSKMKVGSKEYTSSEDAYFEFTRSGKDQTYTCTLENFKTGTMPFGVSLTVSDVEVKDDGTFRLEDPSKHKLVVGPVQYPLSLFEGKFSPSKENGGYTVRVSIQTKDPMIPVELVFEGARLVAATE